jgi:hypothetical protein
MRMMFDVAGFEAERLFVTGPYVNHTSDFADRGPGLPASRCVFSWFPAVLGERPADVVLFAGEVAGLVAPDVSGRSDLSFEKLSSIARLLSRVVRYLATRQRPGLSA